MNIALIFAGGTGERMNSKAKPKQFLELHGKPILIYTLEQFEKHKLIDGIILVVLDGWQDYCLELKERYQIHKLQSIIPGGATAQESTFLGLKEAAKLYGSNPIMLIHDGVRPLIDAETITKDIECVISSGNAITVYPATETVTVKGRQGVIGEILERSRCEMARAPQCFFLKDVLGAYEKIGIEELGRFIDSASVMQSLGYNLYSVIGPSENIKITTPGDFYIFKAIVEAKENYQLFGV